MNKIRLGRTELLVSRIGMGGGPIQRPSEKQAIQVVRRALDLGVNFVDTARAYRTSEERIGKAVAGRRDQVIITTKGWGAKRAVQESIEESLRQLDTDYIDLWQFHDISTFEEYAQVLGPAGETTAAAVSQRMSETRVQPRTVD